MLLIGYWACKTLTSPHLSPPRRWGPMQTLPNRNAFDTMYTGFSAPPPTTSPVTYLTSPPSMPEGDRIEMEVCSRPLKNKSSSIFCPNLLDEINLNAGLT